MSIFCRQKLWENILDFPWRALPSKFRVPTQVSFTGPLEGHRNLRLRFSQFTDLGLADNERNNNNGA